MKTLLVPVDFSDVTEKIVATAASLAELLGCRVILVHVVEPVPEFVGYDPGPLSVRVATPVDLGADRDRLEKLKERFGKTEVLAVQADGSTPERILALAAEHGADMIVMGSHGHGALFHLLAGSVTTAVLKAAPCPVLIIPNAVAA